MHLRTRTAFSVLFFILILTPAAHAADRSWLVASSGNFSDGTNWSGGSAPGPGDNAIIDVDGTYTVTLDVAVTVDNLTLGGTSGLATLAGSGNTLDVTGIADISAFGRLHLTGSSSIGTVNSSGEVDVARSGNVFTTYNTTSSSVLSLDNTGFLEDIALTITNNVTNNGLVEFQNEWNTTLADLVLTITGGEFTNTPTGVVRTPVAGLPSGTRKIAAQIGNQGLFEMRRSFIIDQPDADHTNSGDFTLISGNVTLTQSGASPSFTHSGTIDVANNYTFDVFDGVFTHDPGTTSGAGSVRFQGTQIVDVTHAETGAILRLAGDTSTNSIANSGTVIVARSNNVITDYSTTSAAFLSLDNTQFLEDVALTITNNVTNNGVVEFQNEWNTTLADLVLTITGGEFTSTPTGVVRTPVAGLPSGTRKIAAQIDNQGLFEMRRSFIIDQPDADHTNSGDFTLISGNVTLTQSGASPSFAHSGTIDVANNYTFDVFDGVFTHDPGTTSGAGSVRFQGTQIVDVTHAETGATLRLAGDTSTNSIANSGTVIVARSNNVITDYSTTSTAFLSLDNTQFLEDVALTITNNVTNNGVVEFQNEWNTTLADLVLTITGGEFTSTPTGVVRTPVAGLPSGTRKIAAQIDNQGLFEMRRSFIIDQPDADHTNSGDFTLISGNVTLTQSGASPSFAHSGTIDVANNYTFDVFDGVFTHDPGTTSGAGSVRFQGTQIVDVTHAETGATLRLAGDTSTNSIANSGTVIVARSNNVITDYSTTSTAFLSLDNTQFLEDVALTITNNVTNNGLVEFQNEWNTTLADLVLTITGGEFTSTPTGVVRTPVAGLPSGTRKIAAQIDNQGLFEMRRSFIIDQPDADHTNSGDFTLISGNVTLTQSGASPSFTHSGTIDVANNYTFDVFDGVFTHDPGTTSGAGSVRFQGTQIVDVTHAETGAILRLAGDTSTNSIANSGTVIVARSNNVITDYSTTSTAFLSLDNTQFLEDVALTITNNVTNNGVVEFQNEWNTTLADLVLTITGGEFTSTPTGVVRTPVAGLPSGTRKIAAQIDNQGLFEMRRSFIIDQPDADHTNSGDFTLISGNVTLTQSGASPSFTHSGNIDVTSPYVFSITGGTFTHDPGTTTGDGAVRFQDVQLVDVTQAETAATLQLYGDTSTNSLTSSGDVIVARSNNVITGYANSATGLLALNNNDAPEDIDLVITNPVTNLGSIEFVNRWNTPLADLTLTVNDDFVNAPSGSVAAPVAGFVSGTRTVTCDTVSNEGLVSAIRSLNFGLEFTNQPGGILEGASTIAFDGVFTDGGTTAPGYPGNAHTLLTLEGDDPRDGTAALNVDLGGTSGGNNHDRLSVTGTAALAGALNINYVDGFEPALGDSFAILVAPFVQDSFEFFTGLLTPTGLLMEVSVKPNQVDLIAGPAPDNDPPVAVTDSLSTPEDMQIVFDAIANDSDPDGDTVAVVPGTLTMPANGSATLLLSGEIRYIPDPDFHGEDTFEYTITDFRGGDATGTVIIDVKSINDGPLFVSPTPTGTSIFDVMPDEPVAFTVRASDVDDPDTVTLTSSLLPPAALMTPNLPTAGNPVESSFSWTPTTSDLGIYDITFTATDDSSAFVERTIRIRVADPTPVLLSLFEVRNTDDGLELRWRYGNPRDIVSDGLQRSASDVGPWVDVSLDRSAVGDIQIARDRNVEDGGTYYYRLVATDNVGDTEFFGPLRATASLTPSVFALSPVRPNPVRGVAQISFSLADRSPVQLRVFDVRGRMIESLVNETMAGGRYEVLWAPELDGRKLPAGVYFIQLNAGRERFVQRVVHAR